MFDSVTATPELVAVVGPPNSGKTTLFNWLTNSKFKTVNYPGATVEYSVAELAPQFGGGLTVMDTPGTYSLVPKSEDEEVTLRALYGHSREGDVSKVIAVIDSTQLSRHLLLVQRLISSGFSVVVALTMSDLMRKSGQSIDVDKLSASLQCPVFPIEGLLGGGLNDLVEGVRNLRAPTLTKSAAPKVWTQEQQMSMLKSADLLAVAVCGKATAAQKAALLATTRRLDRWLLHPFFGLLIFVLVMSFLFTTIFAVAGPFMDAIDSFFSMSAAKVASAGDGSLWIDFIGNGVITSFGAVLVFVPQIFMLFLVIGFLESSGYLARSATLIDRPLSSLGMSGRSFVPLLSGFACAVPALMATRNISSKRDRFITMMIIPLMTCSARLPVYALLLAFLFNGRPSWQAGLALTALYFGALFFGAIVAHILHRFLKPEANSFFMMELPLYRRPRFGVVLNQAWTKTFGYVKRAGPPIFLFALLIWAGTTFPNYQAESDQVKLETSYAGQLGHFIEPVFKPMGVDWRVGVSLISAFAAREVFASSLAVIFDVTASDDEGLQEGLLASMEAAQNSEGLHVFTTASVLAILIFVMVALQCTSTTAVMIRESGQFTWAILQLLVYNILAYVLAVGVYQLWS